MSRLAYAVSLRPHLASIVFFAVLAFPSGAAASGSDLPPGIVLPGFVKPDHGRMHLLVRIPLLFLQPFALPKRGPGYLDLTPMDELMRQAAAAGR